MGIVNKHNYKLKLSHKLNHSLLFPRQYSSTPASVKLLLHDVVSQAVQLLTEKRVLWYQLWDRTTLRHFDWMLQSPSGWKKSKAFSANVGKVFQSQSCNQRTLFSIYAGANWEATTSSTAILQPLWSISHRMLFPRQNSSSEKPLPQNVAATNESLSM